MERRSEMTKALLGEKFKELVVKKSFDKLTIKMITDAAGVIRPTFYNYFQDKYEVMDWLLREDIFKSVTELIDMEMDLEAMKMLFRKFEADREYYAKAFEVKGQNSFEEMLFEQVYELVEKIVKKHPLKVDDTSEIISEEIFLKFQSITLVNGIKYWLTYNKKEISADEALKFYEFLMTHSLLEIVDNDILDKVIN